MTAIVLPDIDHALRHTGATLACKYTHDLRAVQDLLGHADPRTTARYARVVDKALNNPAAAVQVVKASGEAALMTIAL